MTHPRFRRRFSVEEDEGSFFASYSILDRGPEGNGVMCYDVTENPGVMPHALVREWIKELRVVGRCTPMEIRVALDLLLYYVIKDQESRLPPQVVP